MPKPEWVTLRRDDDPRNPDYVMRLTDRDAIWLQNCNGYDVLFVRLKPDIETVTSRADIDVIRHAVPAMPNHDSGYAGSVVKEQALFLMSRYAARNAEDHDRDAAGWHAAHQAMLDASPGLKARLPVEQKRFRNREGWFCQVGDEFSVFVEDVTNQWSQRDDPEGHRRFVWWFMQGTSRKVVMRGQTTMPGVDAMIAYVFEQGREYVAEQAATLNSALQTFMGSVPADA